MNKPFKLLSILTIVSVVILCFVIPCGAFAGVGMGDTSTSVVDIFSPYELQLHPSREDLAFLDFAFIGLSPRATNDDSTVHASYTSTGDAGEFYTYNSYATFKYTQNTYRPEDYEESFEWINVLFPTYSILDQTKNINFTGRIYTLHEYFNASAPSNIRVQITYDYSGYATNIDTNDNVTRSLVTGSEVVDLTWYYNSSQRCYSGSFSPTKLIVDRLPISLTDVVVSDMSLHYGIQESLVIGFGFDTYTTDFLGLSYSVPRPESVPLMIVEEVIEVNPIKWLTDSITGFFETEILPEDTTNDLPPVTIGSVFWLVLAIPLLVAFLKLFAGG